MQPGCFQSRKHVVARFFGAELCGKTLRIEERRQPRDDAAFALSVLLLSEPGIGGGAHRVDHQPMHATGIIRERTVEDVDRFAMLAEEIFRDA